MKNHIAIFRNSRRSIAQRLSLSFISVFVAIFIIFTVLAFITTEKTLLEGEKDKASQTIKFLESQLKVGTSPYTLGNLAEVIYKNAVTDDVIEKEGSYYFSRTEHDVTNLLYSNQEIYIYGKSKTLLFTTDSSDEFIPYSDQEVVLRNKKNEQPGLLIGRDIYSDETGEWIGRIQLFHHLSYYYQLRQQLLLIIVIIQLVGLAVGFVFLNLLTKRQLQPLKTLNGVMRSISQNPNNISMRSSLQTGDELEDLSDIFDGMLDRLEEYNELQSRFISDVSHELRTPIAVIQGHLGLLMRWGKDDPEILDESLEASYNEANRMSLMINEMLATVRLKGDFAQHKEAVSDVGAVIKTVVSNFKVLHPEVVFEVHNHPDKLLAQMLSNHLEQALTIVFDNAVKYSIDSKEICIAVHRTEEDVVLSISDKGEGIAEEDLKHIFERFYRTDKSRNRLSTQAGLGIGLSILKQIVNGYHGHIDIKSQLGKGTEIILYFPLVK